ncbi:MAG TPA: hypothetical protein VFS70_17295, partial [Actinomycetota bacterium]|nr:hypothetical protein [Actinomycetota bacterium]
MPPLPRSRDRRGVQVGFDRVGFWIDTSGVGAAGDGLSLLEEGIQQLLRQRIVVGSALPYAYGINFGHHRSG